MSRGVVTDDLSCEAAQRGGPDLPAFEPPLAYFRPLAFSMEQLRAFDKAKLFHRGEDANPLPARALLLVYLPRADLGPGADLAEGSVPDGMHFAVCTVLLNAEVKLHASFERAAYAAVFHYHNLKPERQQELGYTAAMAPASEDGVDFDTLDGLVALRAESWGPDFTSYTSKLVLGRVYRNPVFDNVAYYPAEFSVSVHGLFLLDPGPDPVYDHGQIRTKVTPRADQALHRINPGIPVAVHCIRVDKGSHRPLGKDFTPAALGDTEDEQRLNRVVFDQHTEWKDHPNPNRYDARQRFRETFNLAREHTLSSDESRFSDGGTPRPWLPKFRTVLGRADLLKDLKQAEDQAREETGEASGAKDVLDSSSLNITQLFQRVGDAPDDDVIVMERVAEGAEGEASEHEPVSLIDILKPIALCHLMVGVTNPAFLLGNWLFSQHGRLELARRGVFLRDIKITTAAESEAQRLINCPLTGNLPDPIAGITALLEAMHRPADAGPDAATLEAITRRLGEFQISGTPLAQVCPRVTEVKSCLEGLSSFADRAHSGEARALEIQKAFEERVSARVETFKRELCSDVEAAVKQAAEGEIGRAHV